MTKLDLDALIQALINAPNYNAWLGTATLEWEAADCIKNLSARLRELTDENKQLADAAVCNPNRERVRELEAKNERLRDGLKLWMEVCEQYNVSIVQFQNWAKKAKGGTDGDTEMRWIPVNERLPEEYVCVIGWEPNTGVRLVCNAFDDMDDVTHWMPLPAGPEGETK